MKTTAPKELGILVVAGVFGIIGGGVSLVAWNTSFIAALFVAGLVAVIVAIVLWLGWREPKARDTSPRPVGRGPGNVPTTTDAHRAGDGPPGVGAAAQANTAAESSATRAPSTADTSAAPTSSHAGAGAAGATAVKAEGDATATGGGMKPSAKLAGQDDLADRKGEWTYDAPGKSKTQADATPDAGSGAKAHPGADGASAVAATPTDAGKPKMLDSARDSGADNLKEIKGVGPKLETMLNDMGIYHFDQIAGWSDTELAWVDDNLAGFKGRASRDNWVSQAKTLSSGGETEFSKRVDKGGVY